MQSMHTMIDPCLSHKRYNPHPFFSPSEARYLYIIHTDISIVFVFSYVDYYRLRGLIPLRHATISLGDAAKNNKQIN